MFQKIKNILPQTLPTIILATLLTISIIYAWTEPSQAPPGGNVSAPVNVGSATQYKSGALGIGSLFWAFSDAIFNGKVGIGTTAPGAKLDVQDGDINTSGKLKEEGNSLIPSGAVMSFNLSSCPAGWTELTQARGRYIVGLTLGGALPGSPGTACTDGSNCRGTALTNLENRAVGQHNHSITDPTHRHGIGSDVSINEGTTYRPYPDVNSNTGRLSSYSSTGITINNEGTTAGTNAPYIQLLVCQKN